MGLGHHRDARQWLTKANKWTETTKAGRRDDLLLPLTDDWLEFQVLSRETPQAIPLEAKK